MPALQFTRRYAMAHRLLATDSERCRIPHGHNEFVSVRLDPVSSFKFSETNALAPFEKIKRRWHAWIDGSVDHTLHLAESDPLIAYFRQHEPARLSQIMTFQGDPTTEALAACFFLKLSALIVNEALPFTVGEVRIEETPTNTVVLPRTLFDQEAFGVRAGSWPTRADMSINDF